MPSLSAAIRQGAMCSLSSWALVCYDSHRHICGAALLAWDGCSPSWRHPHTCHLAYLEPNSQRLLYILGALAISTSLNTGAKYLQILQSRHCGACGSGVMRIVNRHCVLFMHFNLFYLYLVNVQVWPDWHTAVLYSAHLGWITSEQRGNSIQE